MSQKVKISIAVFTVAAIAVASVLFLINKQPVAENTDLPEVITNPPLGCAQTSSLVVKSTATSTLNILTSRSYFIHWRNDQGTLIFTNYKLDLDNVDAAVAGTDAKVSIKLAHMDLTDLAIGTYKKTSETAGKAPNQYTSEFNISTINYQLGILDNNGSVQINYIGDDYVCGTIMISDGSSSIMGDFVAKYVDKL